MNFSTQACKIKRTLLYVDILCTLYTTVYTTDSILIQADTEGDITVPAAVEMDCGQQSSCGTNYKKDITPAERRNIQLYMLNIPREYAKQNGKLQFRTASCNIELVGVRGSFQGAKGAVP